MKLLETKKKSKSPIYPYQVISMLRTIFYILQLSQIYFLIMSLFSQTLHDLLQVLIFFFTLVYYTLSSFEMFVSFINILGQSINRYCSILLGLSIPRKHHTKYSSYRFLQSHHAIYSYQSQVNV